MSDFSPTADEIAIAWEQERSIRQRIINRLEAQNARMRTMLRETLVWIGPDSDYANYPDAPTEDLVRRIEADLKK